MATSRLEKVGSIVSRLDGLIQAKFLTGDQIPIWHSVYKAFPPQNEPILNRPAPDINSLKPIFYAEDKERANRTVVHTQKMKKNKKTRANFKSPS